MIDWQWAEADILENQGKWNEAKLFLLEKWRENPYYPKAAIRLGFFCWYVSVEDEGKEEDIDFDEIDCILKEVTDFGLANFKENTDFLWCFGYMISLFPYLFGDYELWKKKGDSMLKSAWEKCPDEPVYRYSYLGSTSTSRLERKEEFFRLQTVLEDRFRGEGVLALYFKGVWHSWYE